jgi:organic radical activating enzyme
MSDGKTYRVNEIFYSLQGEGVRAGTANVFVRLSGCNMRCDTAEGPRSPGGFKCDTEFESGVNMTAADIIAQARALSPRCDWVILTGGEPGLQADAPLLEAFHAGEFKVAIETNGSVRLPDGVDWITVSPKVAEHAIEQLVAHEVKYVRGYGQGLPNPRTAAPHQLISPAFDGGIVSRETMAWCIELVRANPSWRLSVQQHKGWVIR